MMVKGCPSADGRGLKLIDEYFAVPRQPRRRASKTISSHFRSRPSCRRSLSGRCEGLRSRSVSAGNSSKALMLYPIQPEKGRGNAACGTRSYKGRGYMGVARPYRRSSCQGLANAASFTPVFSETSVTVTSPFFWPFWKIITFDGTLMPAESLNSRYCS